MASRVELIRMCKELDIKYEDLSIKEMKDAVRAAADKKFVKRYNISADRLSKTLKKFLLNEYHFIMKDKDGNLLNYRGEKI